MYIQYGACVSPRSRPAPPPSLNSTMVWCGIIDHTVPGRAELEQRPFFSVLRKPSTAFDHHMLALMTATLAFAARSAILTTPTSLRAPVTSMSSIESSACSPPRSSLGKSLGLVLGAAPIEGLTPRKQAIPVKSMESSACFPPRSALGKSLGLVLGAEGVYGKVVPTAPNPVTSMESTAVSPPRTSLGETLGLVVENQ